MLNSIPNLELTYRLYFFSIKNLELSVLGISVEQHGFFALYSLNLRAMFFFIIFFILKTETFIRLPLVYYRYKKEEEKMAMMYISLYTTKSNL